MNDQERIKLIKQMEVSHEACCRLWSKILKLKHELLTLTEAHNKQKKIYESADRELAEVDRMTKVVVQRKSEESVLKGFSKEQLLKLAEELKEEENN